MPLPHIARASRHWGESSRAAAGRFSAYRVLDEIAGLLAARQQTALSPGDFPRALHARLDAVERRAAWERFRRVLARCAAALVIEGDETE